MGGGGEYRNVSSFLQTHGIVYRVSCPHTPEQNGASERCNRVIVEKGLALLAHSKLPVTFWEQAFHTAIYTNNRTITPVLNHKSPYECLYNRPPDYPFLKSFGCLCYPYIRPYNSNKLEFRSLPCVFLGYSAKHKGYLCFHVPSSRTYIARHVVFDESSFPFPEHGSKANFDHLINSDLRLHTLHEASTIGLPSTPSPTSSSSMPTASSTESGEFAMQTDGSSSDPSGLMPHSPSGPTPEHNSGLSPISSGLTPIESHSGLTPPNSPSVEPPPPPVVPTADPYPNAPSYFRPSTNSEHVMVTHASTSSLKPKSFTATKYPLNHDSSEIEPKTFLQAKKNPNWQHVMQLEFDALMSNRTWELVPSPLLLMLWVASGFSGLRET